MKRQTSLAIALMLATTAAQAAMLPPGSPPSIPDNFPFPTGSLLASISGTYAGSATDTIHGTYAESVVTDPHNVFCSGCLDFIFFVTNDSNSLDNIARITHAPFVNGVTPFMTDVGYATGTGSTFGTLPTTVDRLSADTVGFSFSTGVAPGSNTQTLEIQTNATGFMPGHLQISDGSVATVNAFAPTGTAVVPLPAALWLLLSSVAALGLLARKRALPE
jgi:hypothetical protein